MIARTDPNEQESVVLLDAPGPQELASCHERPQPRARRARRRGLRARAGGACAGDDERPRGRPGPSVVLALTLGWAFIGAGLYAWWRRPENRIGAADDDGRVRLVPRRADQRRQRVGVHDRPGAELAVDRGARAHAGRVPDRPGGAGARAQTSCGSSGSPRSSLGRSRCSSSRTRTATTARTTCCWSGRTRPRPPCSRRIGLLVLVVVLGGLVVVLIRRWRSFGPVQRRALSPVLWTGTAVAVVALLTVVTQPLASDDVTAVLDAVLTVLITAVPFAFLVGLMRSIALARRRGERAVRAARRRERARRAGRGARRRHADARVLAARPAAGTSTPQGHDGGARGRA